MILFSCVARLFSLALLFVLIAGLMFSSGCVCPLFGPTPPTPSRSPSAPSPPTAPSSAISTTPLTGNSSLLLYTNAPDRFSIAFPKDWEVNTSHEGHDVHFTAPGFSSADAGAPNVQIYSPPADSSTTLSGFTKKYRAILAQDYQIMSDDDSVEVAGQPGYGVVVKGRTPEGTPIVMTQAWMVQNGHVYIEVYSSNTDDYNSYADDAQSIMRSLSLSGPSSSDVQAPPSSTPSSPSPSPNVQPSPSPPSSPSSGWIDWSNPKPASPILPNAAGSWRLYPSYTTSMPSASKLELSPLGTWQFGTSVGLYHVEQISDDDWKNWGVDAYGPNYKIVLDGWNGHRASGPIETETDGTVDFIWVIYESERGQVQLKFGH